MISKETQLTDLISRNLISVKPDTNGVDVFEILEKSEFHHLPVINSEGECVGMISKTDYYRLQDKFSKLDLSSAVRNNSLYFRSLIATDIMSSDLVQLDIDANIDDAIGLLLENKVHSIVITENNKCVGILTPYDILKQIKKERNQKFLGTKS
jgi:CBS domain-containing protein